MLRYGYLEVFQSPLEFEITRVDCMYIVIALYMALNKIFLQSISIDFFFFLHKNICCGYSLEVPR